MVVRNAQPTRRELLSRASFECCSNHWTDSLAGLFAVAWVRLGLAGGEEAGWFGTHYIMIEATPVFLGPTEQDSTFAWLAFSRNFEMISLALNQRLPSKSFGSNCATAWKFSATTYQIKWNPKELSRPSSARRGRPTARATPGY